MHRVDSFISLIISNPTLKLCQAIHALSTKLSFLSDLSLQISILRAYSDNGSLRDVHHLLDEMPQRDPLPWNLAISTFFRLGNVDAAHQLFSRMQYPNEVTWSALVSGLAQTGRARDCLVAFCEMRSKHPIGLPVASNTITSTLSACGQLKNLLFGQQVHTFALKISDYAESDEFVGPALVDMYGKCGYMQLSQKAFEFLHVKNVVSWSSLIANFVKSNHPVIAINIFREMVNTSSDPNDVTLTTVISACAQIAYFLNGKELHAYSLKRLVFRPDRYISTALVSMYCQCGAMVYAYRILNNDRTHLGVNQPSMWNSILAYHVENGSLPDAIDVLKSMCNAQVPLNAITLAIIFPICGQFTEVLYGKELHCYAIKHGLGKETIVGNSLLDLYCKSGKTRLAYHLFDRMLEKSLVSWTTLINGYATQGDGFGAIQLFEKMLSEGDIVPDNVTFVVLISACSHSGLVEEGLKYFEMMTRHFGIIPTEENYGSLVDLLARAGYIEEARNVLKLMPIEPGSNVWGAFMGACRIHMDADRAKVAARRLHELQPDGTGFHKLLSNVYAGMGRRNSAAELQREKGEVGFMVKKGTSWLETARSF